MLFVELSDGRKLKIYWHHITNIQPEEKSPYFKANAFTECIIEQELSYNKKVWFGRAYCSKADTFNKETGRKISLMRTLQDAIPYSYYRNVDAKKLRREVWRAYFYRLKNVPEFAKEL